MTQGINPDALRVRRYPDPVLRVKGLPLRTPDPALYAVSARMFELMHKHKGIGLAAPQVGLSWRLFVLDVPKKRAEEDAPTRPTPDAAPLQIHSGGPMVFVNPELTLPRSPVVAYEEGCLSLPEVHGDVLRPATVRVRATNEHGEAFELHAAGLLARCIQHEFDHIEGVLILDKMTASARIKNRLAIKDLG